MKPNNASPQDDNVDDVNEQGEPSEEGTGNESSSEERIAALEAQIAQLNAEAAKQRKLKQKAIKERDEAKNAPTDGKNENYKELWEQERSVREALESKARKASINAAVTAQLTKAGVLKDATDAAAKLIDEDLIEYDTESGLDSASVEAAIAVLKHKHSFLFESKVSSTKPKQPAESSGPSDKTMTRSEFNKLSPMEKAGKIKAGFTLTDD